MERGNLEDADEAMLVDEETETNEVFLAQMEHYAYAVTCRRLRQKLNGGRS